MKNKVLEMLEVLDREGYTIADVITLVRCINATDEVTKTFKATSSKFTKCELDAGEHQKERASVTTDINYKIEMVFQEMGINSNRKAYKYLLTAVELAYNDLSVMQDVMESIYGEIGKKYNKKSITVMNGIQELIKSTWENMSEDVACKYFGKDASGKYRKNSRFIRKIAEYLKTQDKL